MGFRPGVPGCHLLPVLRGLGLGWAGGGMAPLGMDVVNQSRLRSTPQPVGFHRSTSSARASSSAERCAPAPRSHFLMTDWFLTTQLSGTTN